MNAWQDARDLSSKLTLIAILPDSYGAVYKMTIPSAFFDQFSVLMMGQEIPVIGITPPLTIVPHLLELLAPAPNTLILPPAQVVTIKWFNKHHGERWMQSSTFSFELEL